MDLLFPRVVSWRKSEHVDACPSPRLCSPRGAVDLSRCVVVDLSFVWAVRLGSSLGANCHTATWPGSRYIAASDARRRVCWLALAFINRDC